VELLLYAVCLLLFIMCLNDSMSYFKIQYACLCLCCIIYVLFVSLHTGTWTVLFSFASFSEHMRIWCDFVVIINSCGYYLLL
jgi:hypothetical protein